MPSRNFTREGVSAEAGSIVALLRKRTRRGASILALRGNLGAGKTTLVQAIAALLGITADITSPTFVILKSYPAMDPDFAKLIHIDAYRILDPEELTILGFEEVMKDPHTLIIIEWPERVEELLPHDAMHVTLSHVNEDTRAISYT